MANGSCIIVRPWIPINCYKFLKIYVCSLYNVSWIHSALIALNTIMTVKKTCLVFRSCGCFRANRRSNKNAVFPVEGFVNQRYTSWASATEQDGINRYSFRIFPSGINNWALASRGAKSDRKYSYFYIV